MNLTIANGLILGLTLAAGLGGWFYLSRYRLTRPPIGVFNFYDLLALMLGIIIAPYLYLILPLGLAGGLLVTASGSILYLTLEGFFPRLGRARLMGMMLALLGLDGLAVGLSGPDPNLKFAVNNLVLLVVVIGLANLWVQSGMQPGHVAALGAFLAVYDYLATTITGLTGGLFEKLAGLPLAPVFGWANGNSFVGIGLGDLLLATVFPLVVRKAFGSKAGWLALGLSQLAIGVLLVLPLSGVFPVMVVLGPLMVVWLGMAGWLQREPARRKVIEIPA